MSRRRSRRLSWALLLSLGVHALLLLALVDRLTTTPVGRFESVQRQIRERVTIAFRAIARTTSRPIVQVTSTAAVHPHVLPERETAPVRVPQIRRAAPIAHAATTPVTNDRPNPHRIDRRVSPPMAAAIEAVNIDGAAPLVRAPTALPTVAAAPSPTPTVAAIAANAAVERVAVRGDDAPPGGWGQTFASPLIADDGELGTLRAAFAGVRGITISVDADGHATRVEIPASVTSERRADLERQLLELRYVPAECNGLRCSGTLRLSL